MGIGGKVSGIVYIVLLYLISIFLVACSGGDDRESTRIDEGLEKYAGNYKGVFLDNNNEKVGSWDFVVDIRGDITGSANHQEWDGKKEISNSINSSGDFTLPIDIGDGFTVQGKISPLKNVAGTWKKSIDHAGSMRGKTTDVPPEGTLIVATTGEIRYSDPNRESANLFFHGGVSGSLIRRNTSHGRYSRSLARSWELIDSTTWKFTLQKGIKFHNGLTVTSADVKYSFDRTMGKFDPRFRGFRRATLRRVIAAIETPDEYTIIFKTKDPDSSFLGIPQLLQIVPKAYVEKVGDREFAKKTIGFGPWKVKEIKVGESIEIEAFEHYWNVNPQPGEMGRPKIKSFIVRTLPKQATMVAALKAGEIDSIMGVRADMVEELRAMNNITVYQSPSPLQGFIIMNCRSRSDPPNPLRDIRVRQALNYALDWDAIIKNFLTGKEYRTTLIDKDQIGYDPNTHKFPYDPEKAKTLLAEAGYADGFTIPYHYVSSEHSPTREVIWDYWRKVGVRVDPQAHTFPVVVRGVYSKSFLGLVPWASGVSRDPGNWLRVMIPYDGEHALHARHKKAEELFEKQSTEFDENKRAELIKQLNEIVLREVWLIPAVRGVFSWALNTGKWTVDTSKEPLATFPATWISLKKGDIKANESRR
jgi:peptide/nickel transport system substrate-binding protein